MGFRSSIGTNGTIGTNRVTWHSIGTPLVNCIALMGSRLFSLRFGSSTVGFRSSIGSNGTIGTNRVTWHSIGTPLVKWISLTHVSRLKLERMVDWYHWYQWKSIQSIG